MLRSVELPDPIIQESVSPESAALLAEAEKRIDDFLHRRKGPLIENFVASDFRTVDAALKWIVDRRLTAGQMFCEWGCGFGVVTMLAAIHGFTAFGIEVEQELVDHAHTLAHDLDIPVEVAHGSFIPEERDEFFRFPEDVAHIETESPPAYEELDLDIADFDLFFAFPWPGETRFWDELFLKYASDGALLLTYHGIEDLRLQRKVRA